MPTFQLIPECYVRGLGQGFLPRGGYVVQTIADVEDHAKGKPNKRGVYFTLRVTHAYLYDEATKTFVQDSKDTIGREIKTQVFYPEGNEHDRHALSAMLTILVGYGAYSAEQAKQMLAANAAFEFGPGMFTNRQAFLIYDPPPADAGPDVYQEVAFAPQAEFSEIISGQRPIAWPQDKKSAKAQGKVAANPAGSSAGKMITGPANVPTPNVPTPGGVATAPPPSAPPAGFAAPPGAAPATAPATAAPGAWTPGMPAPGAFASPPPGTPAPAPANGAQPGSWGAPGAAAQPAGRGW